jgi:hypothetical protein
VWRKDIKKYHKKESAKIKEKGREQKEWNRNITW